MAPKRKRGRPAGGRGKKAKTEAQASPPDLTGKETYCAEVGIDLENGGSQAVYQWLCCSIIFGNRISEKTTIRAAKGLINSGLTDPKSVKDASWQEKIDALNSEGNVQRGPSMSERLGSTAETVLEKYEGDLSKLREAAKNNPNQIKKLVKEFKGIGDTGVDIFFREAQLQWEELFPFADKNSLKLAKEHGYPSKNAKELAEFVGNDRKKFVALLAALTKDELRDTNILADGADDAKDNGKEEDKKEEEPAEKAEDQEEAPEKPKEKPDEPMNEAENAEPEKKDDAETETAKDAEAKEPEAKEPEAKEKTEAVETEGKAQQAEKTDVKQDEGEKGTD